MFAHIFTNRLKCLVRNPITLFWTLIFPIVLGFFFNLSLPNVYGDETFSPIPVAVVNNETYQKDAAFQTALRSVSEGKDKIFTLTVATKEKAESLLADSKVAGILNDGTTIGMTVNHSDFNQSILQSFLDSYLQTSSAVSGIMSENPAAYQKMAEKLKEQTDYIKNAPIGNASPNGALTYFYALIAMACLYGCFWGMQEVTDIQADMSQQAARINLVPVHKLKIFFSSLTAAFVINYSEILIFLAFLRYVLNVDFGPRTGYVILTSLVGCITGLSFGSFISALVKSGEGLKTGICLAFTMTGCVLSGMMSQDILYSVRQNAPIIEYLNPVNLLTDSFYSLYYFTSLSRYWLNIGLLCAFIILFCTVTYLIIRRRKYASL